MSEHIKAQQPEYTISVEWLRGDEITEAYRLFAQEYNQQLSHSDSADAHFDPLPPLESELCKDRKTLIKKFEGCPECFVNYLDTHYQEIPFVIDDVKSLH